MFPPVCWKFLSLIPSLCCPNIHFTSTSPIRVRYAIRIQPFFCAYFTPNHTPRASRVPWVTVCRVMPYRRSHNPIHPSIPSFASPRARLSGDREAFDRFDSIKMRSKALQGGDWRWNGGRDESASKSPCPPAVLLLYAVSCWQLAGTLSAGGKESNLCWLQENVETK